MPDGSLRYRQVHLDFHTSPRIPGVGSLFDADAFGDAFAAAHVDSVTVFSKCHHGLSYHPTTVGRMHPTLSFDLLRAQIDALHARKINAVVYLSATWDEHAADAHADWRAVSPDGSLPRFRAEPAGAGWAMMDFASPYLDYLCAQVDETIGRYPDADGVFMDISWQVPTISAHARRQMEAQGLDWTDAAHRERFTAQAVEAYYDRVTATVRRHNPAMPLFFNAGHIRRGLRNHYRRFYSHLEVESLPTAAWGYDHFPLSARYVDTLGFDFLGMTGKFHWSWGEVGGYKKPEAMLYECGAMLAQGARCSIGDHLHPTGAIDASTMAVIAPAYDWVAAREPWCEGTANLAEIGLLSVEAVIQTGLGRRPNKNTVPDEGVARVLLEGGFTFDVLDLESDFAPYRLLILPDVVRVGDELKARVEAYLAQGGRVLLTGQSGLAPEGGFALDVGAQWLGTSPMTGGDYLLPVPGLRAEGVNDPLFMYHPSERIQLVDGASLGEVFDPYMDRAPGHFSGHVNAPSQPEPSGFDAGSAKDGITYAAHPIFSCYHEVGAVAMLEVAERLVARALGTPRMLRTTLPRAGRATLRRSGPRGSDVLHLLHATPAVRGELGGAALQPIQDLVTLHDIEVSIARTTPVAAVTLVPERTSLPFALTDGRLEFTVPRLHGHGMVEIAAD
jgi:hypothetical protein